MEICITALVTKIKIYAATRTNIALHLAILSICKVLNRQVINNALGALARGITPLLGGHRYNFTAGSPCTGSLQAWLCDMNIFLAWFDPPYSPHHFIPLDIHLDICHELSPGLELLVQSWCNEMQFLENPFRCYISVVAAYPGSWMNSLGDNDGGSIKDWNNVCSGRPE